MILIFCLVFSTKFISLSTSSNVLGFKSISIGFLLINLPKHFSTSFKETAQTEHCDCVIITSGSSSLSKSDFTS